MTLRKTLGIAYLARPRILDRVPLITNGKQLAEYEVMEGELTLRACAILRARKGRVDKRAQAQV